MTDLHLVILPELRIHYGVKRGYILQIAASKGSSIYHATGASDDETVAHFYVIYTIGSEGTSCSSCASCKEGKVNFFHHGITLALLEFFEISNFEHGCDHTLG